MIRDTSSLQSERRPEQRPPYVLNILQRKLILTIHQRGSEASLEKLCEQHGFARRDDVTRIRRCLANLTPLFILPGDGIDTFLLTPRAQEIALNIQAASV